jgi:hypothetical protein
MTPNEDLHYRRPMPTRKTVIKEDHASIRTPILRAPIHLSWRRFLSVISSITNARWWTNTRKPMGVASQPPISTDATQQATAINPWEDERGNSPTAAEKSAAVQSTQ